MIVNFKIKINIRYFFIKDLFKEDANNIPKPQILCLLYLHNHTFPESIYKVPGDDTKFYGTFTTSTNGLMGSAICSFRLTDIQDVFRGKFKEQATSSSAWLPVLSSRVPEPRPGTCVNDTETLPDTVLHFIRSHPLMDSAVMHENEKPVFFKRDIFFTKLVVDKIKVDIGGAVLDYTVYYAGTSKWIFNVIPTRILKEQTIINNSCFRRWKGSQNCRVGQRRRIGLYTFRRV